MSTKSVSAGKIFYLDKEKTEQKMLGIKKTIKNFSR
jgi:hypothetical protein